MAVAVRLPTLLRSHADGAATGTAEGATVGEVFTDLVAKYPGMAGNLYTLAKDVFEVLVLVGVGMAVFRKFEPRLAEEL